MPHLPGRSQRVKDILRLRMHPMTTREICYELGLPMQESKFVASILVGFTTKGFVEVIDGQICSVTSRKLKAYLWSNQAPAQKPPRKPRVARAPKMPKVPKAPPPPPPPPLNPAQAARAAQRRAAVDAARDAYQRQCEIQMAADRKNRARLVFERYTGCRSRDLAEMKAAYRIAAVKHHPDRGGDAKIMAELNSAWSEIGS